MADEKEVEATEGSWDDDSIKKSQGRKLARFRGKQGTTVRMAIVDQNPVKVEQHYKKPFGYLRCIRPLGMKCAACESGDSAAARLGVNIILYPDGAEDGFNVSQVETLAFMFGANAFVDLRNIRAEWGDLRKHDLKVACTNEQYQHLSFTVCKEALYLQDKELAQAVAAKIKAERFDLKKIMGRHFDEEDTAKIWAGTLSRDDLKKRGDSDSSEKKTEETTSASTSTAEAKSAEPAEDTPAPESVDFDELLEGID